MRTALYTICAFLFMIMCLLLDYDYFVSDKSDKISLFVVGMGLLTATSFSLFSDYFKKRKK